jgi:hypothetical protein
MLAQSVDEVKTGEQAGENSSRKRLLAEVDKAEVEDNIEQGSMRRPTVAVVRNMFLDAATARFRLSVNKR